jgi:hypothetical protein
MISVIVPTSSYMPSVNENPMDCVKKNITSEQVDESRESCLYYLANLTLAQQPFSLEHNQTLSEIRLIKSRALFSDRFSMASCGGIVFSGVFAAASCASAYFAAQALDASVVYSMFFSGTANALGNLIMYRDSRRHSHAADLKQDLHRKLCEHYFVLAKCLLEHHYVRLKFFGEPDQNWIRVAGQIKEKCTLILARFNDIFHEPALDSEEIIAPLYDAAHHVFTGSRLYRNDLRDFIHTWNVIPDLPSPISRSSSLFSLSSLSRTESLPAENSANFQNQDFLSLHVSDTELLPENFANFQNQGFSSLDVSDVVIDPVTAL